MTTQPPTEERELEGLGVEEEAEARTCRPPPPPVVDKQEGKSRLLLLRDALPLALIWLLSLSF